MFPIARWLILFSHLSKEACCLALGLQETLVLSQQILYLALAGYVYAYNSTYNVEPKSLANTQYGRLRDL